MNALTSHLPGARRSLSPGRVAVRALGLGIACGGRSTTGPAALALTRTTADERAAFPLSLTGVSRSPLFAGLAVAGELVGDKLPITPSRLQPPALGGRLVSGAASGWALAQRYRVPAAVPASLGALGALVGSVAGARYRAAAARAGRPDLAAALVEDAAVLALAWASARD